MLSEKSIKEISLLFCGDKEGCFARKTGSELVAFFNQYMGYRDKYGPGFPTRWLYISEKIYDFLKNNKFDHFLNVILEIRFIMKDLKCTEIEAIKHSQVVCEVFKEIIKYDSCSIVKINDIYKLIRKEGDLEEVGKGGFALVYRQKSTGLILKKLRREYVLDEKLVSRFKREFNITKSLEDLDGIVKVYDFNNEDYSYLMMDAGTTLDKFIMLSSPASKCREWIIRSILQTMTEVHNRKIIHRDISPNNIFISNKGMVLIADFGLGKDYTMLTSHQTVDTNSFGQISYCSPEQYKKLQDATERSDVFSIGKLINFILTQNADNYEHKFMNFCEKATNKDPNKRYANASELLFAFEEYVNYIDNKKNINEILQEISYGKLTNSIEQFLTNQNGNQLSLFLIENGSFKNILLLYMKKYNTQAVKIVRKINECYKNKCRRSFKAYDPIADFAYEVLVNDFSYDIKQFALEMLIYVAYSVNRYHAQDLVNVLIDSDDLDFRLKKVLTENIEQK